MENYGKIIHRMWDNSFVINNGTYHVPNNEEFKSQWEQVHAYALANPAMVTEEYPYAPSLAELKTAKLNEAGSLFAQKRDARRFVKLDENRYYGFDCASEDITNFLARWAPLAMMGGGESQYKVWLNETEKDLVMLSLADYNLVYQVVSASQLEAYDWYKVVQTQIKACTTKEELEAIVW